MARRRIQISLWWLLVLTTILCIYFGLEKEFARQHQFVQAVESIGGKVKYHPKFWGIIPQVGCYGNIESVDLSRLTVDQEIVKSLPHLRRLQRLYLNRTSVVRGQELGFLDDRDLQHVGKLTELRRLGLWGTSITCDGLEKLKPLQELRLLDIHATDRLNATGAFSTLKEMNSLKRVIMDPPILSNGPLTHLAEMPNVDVGPIKLLRVNDRGIESLAKMNHRCYSIAAMDRCEISVASFAKLAHGGKISVTANVRFTNMPLPCASLRFLPWQSLRNAQLKVSDATIEDILRYVPPPKTVRVGEHLALYQDWDWKSGRSWAPHGYVIWTDITPKSVSKTQLELIPNLEGVIVEHDDEIGDFLSHLRDHTKLTRLKGEIPPNAERVVQQIGQLKNLRIVGLNFLKCKDDPPDVRPLENLKQVTQLNMYGTPFTDDNVDVLEQMKSLKSLTLYSMDHVGERGLPHFLNLKDLEQLTLQTRRNHDASVDVLQQIAKLAEHVDISVGLSPVNRNKIPSPWN